MEMLPLGFLWSDLSRLPWRRRELLLPEIPIRELWKNGRFHGKVTCDVRNLRRNW